MKLFGPSAEVRFSRVNGTVVLVLSLILFIYGTVVWCVVVPWMEFSVPGVTNVALLTATTGLALYCFIGCVLVDPGRVPDNWCPNTEAGVVVEVKKTSGKTRFCQKCNAGKPPRTHHCRVCKRCVLKMDHHCPWMNNCIGHANCKGFILFLLYINAAAVHCMCLLGAAMLHRFDKFAWTEAELLRQQAKQYVSVKWDPGHTLMQTIATVCLIPLMIGLLLLGGWNTYLMFANKTTIEYHEGVTARIKAARMGSSYRHPYDLGPLANLQSILGQHFSLWLLPNTISGTGDGLRFSTIWDFEANVVSVLPSHRSTPSAGSMRTTPTLDYTA